MTELQDNASFNPMMDDEALFAFLGEMDSDWVLEASPLKALDHAPTRKPTISRRIRDKKPRKSRRLDLLQVRDEIADLERQLRILHEKFEFQESLKTHQSNWKLLAMHERVLKKKAEIEQARLRKLVDSHEKFIQQTSAQLQQHIGMLAKAVQGDNRIASLNDAAHIDEIMQICLDLRCRSQLDAIVSQCSDDPTCKLQRVQWKTLPLGDRDIGVEFRESVAMPFKSAFILRTIRPSTVLDVGEYARSNARQSVLTQLSPGPFFTAMTDRQLCLQRLVNTRGNTVLLWEDALSWKPDAESASVIIRCSGWALVTSTADHLDELSVVHAGGFIQIHAMDGAGLKPTDSLVKEIVLCMQSLQRSRCANLENALMDAYCRRKMRDS